MAVVSACCGAHMAPLDRKAAKLAAQKAAKRNGTASVGAKHNATAIPPPPAAVTDDIAPSAVSQPLFTSLPSRTFPLENTGNPPPIGPLPRPPASPVPTTPTAKYLALSPSASLVSSSPPPAVPALQQLLMACPLIIGYRISSSPDHGAHPSRHFNAEVTLSEWHANLPLDVDYGDACMIEAASNVKNAKLLDAPQSWWAKGVAHVRWPRTNPHTASGAHT